MGIITNIITDIAIELSDEFDKNFSNGGFFGERWKNKWDGSSSHLQKSAANNLRNSITCHRLPHGLRWTSNKQYAAIHNEGGKIKITAKQRGFFWYMVKKDKKNSAMWKALALKPVGSEIAMPKRQYIGDHKVVRETVLKITQDCFAEWQKKIIG